MPNTLAYAEIFQSELDKQMLELPTSAWMESNAGQVKYNGGNKVNIPNMSLDGMGDYDRAKGFVDGAVTLTFEQFTMTQDRGRSFMLDSMDIDETNFAATAANVLNEFQRTKVVPEVDAYRYAQIATLATAKSKTHTYTPAQATILATLLNDIATVRDVVGESEPLVITISAKVAAILDTAQGIEKHLSVTDFQSGKVNLKVKAIDEIPLVRVPSARMNDTITINDGTTPGQTAGGYTATGNDINWIICAQKAPIAVSKTDKVRIFNPDQNQNADAYKIDYRKYHDLWIKDNAFDSVIVCLA